MARFPIRLRLTAWYSAILLLGLALFGAGMWLALRERLMAAVDTRLSQRVQGVRTVFGIERIAAGRAQLEEELSEFAKEVPDGGVVQVFDSQGARLLPESAGWESAARAAGPPGHRTIQRDGRPFRVFKGGFEYAGHPYQVFVAAPLVEVETVLRDFRNLLLLMIPGVLLAASLGGYWISRRALAPVDEITRVARSITVQNLSRRLAVPDTGDELQRMSETWNEVLARLDAAFTRIRRFTADASHELRTPLALIRASAELALRRERSSEQYRRSLRDIAAEAERMTALTDSLLILARADSSASDMPLAPTDLNRIAAEVVRANEPLAEEKGIVLRADLAAGSAVAAANEAGIRRLLLILIENAVKHTPPGGTVTVSTSLNDGGIRLCVRDSGEGIAAEALPHVFERFYRADASRGGNGGVGLGLSIARMIAEAHGSHIGVESAPGAGSCFELTLPR